jgi:predicted N-acetyltransferase YhbS
MSDIRIRLARVSEALELSALCRRSKAYWGYDAAFLKACEPALEIASSSIASERVLVAEDENGALLGVVATASLGAGNAFDLAQLFVAPQAIRQGVGEKLFASAVACLRAEGAKTLRIEADPHASGFYARLGARLIGEAPSESVPGRMLPLFEFAIV